MSEYWKSTPKYWCKHCSTFVRDTKLEKANHEASPKHQGNLKRFLRDLHRGHEKDEKDKERAKSEVARLNGLVTGSGIAASASSSSVAGPAKSSAPRSQATAAQVKQQREQLAELGVAVPDEFRPDLALAGEWQVTSERIIGDDESEKKPDARALGIRKRQINDADDEAGDTKKRRWGSTYKLHPSKEEDGDLDALLNNSTRGVKAAAIKSDDRGVKAEVKLEAEAEEPNNQPSDLPRNDELVSGIKQEPKDEHASISEVSESLDANRGAEEAAAGVVFKKRKAKNIRQK